MKHVNIISGLPRSGSTVLSSILNQNPNFLAGVADNTHEIIHATCLASSNPIGISLLNEERRLDILRGIFEGYYKFSSAETVFNSSRSWCSDIALITKLYPEVKIICCVRDIFWILNSFEMLYRKNPTIYSHTTSQLPFLSSVYYRCHANMDEYSGVLGKALASMKTAFYSEFRNNIFVVEYDNLTKFPEITMRKIYEFIEQPYFKHDFNSVDISYDELDLAFQSANLHTVRKRVEFIERDPVLPPDLHERYMHRGYEFWRN